MNKKFYIIPGWTETSRRRQYQSLAKAVRKKGYEVVFKNVDWNKKISQQVFAIEKDSVLFGFSMGAILARLVAQEYTCNLVIFASMTPLRYFKGG
jgi:predicted alpha/beta hydrolase family esterase